MLKFLLSFFVICLLIHFNTSHVLAANTSMSFSPSSGNYNKSFSTSLIINGNGDQFNAASASVEASTNITVEKLTLGDCNLSFLLTPSIENLSFQGIILSSSLKKCTVYTLTLSPSGLGSGTLSILSASVRRFGDAKDVLKLKQNATYNFTGVVKPSNKKPIASINKQKSYSVNITVLHADKPVTNALVKLNSADKKDFKEAKTDNSGQVHFANISSGMYDAFVEDGNRKIGETFINVSGSNYIFNVIINVENPSNSNTIQMSPSSLIQGVTNSPLLMGCLFIIGLILGIGITILILKTKTKK